MTARSSGDTALAAQLEALVTSVPSKRAWLVLYGRSIPTNVATAD
jgi:hypothetical protein